MTLLLHTGVTSIAEVIRHYTASVQDALVLIGVPL